MSNLIPQQRITKDGHVVIRHMRPEGQPESSGRSIPSPAPMAPAATGHKPSKAQMKQRQIVMNRAVIHVAYDVRVALDLEDVKEISFEASDQEMYAVLSVVPFGEALALLESGYRTAGDTKDFLIEFGLDYLEDNPDDSSDEAYRRGIPAEKYCEIKARYGNRLDRETLLDTAETFGMKSLEKSAFYVDVLRGQTNLADIKEIGATRISKCGLVDMGLVREILRDIKSGKVELTSTDLRRLLDATNGNESSVSTAVHLAKQFGTDFTVGLNDISASRWFIDREKRNFKDTDELLKVAVYADALQKSGRESGDARFGVAVYEDFKDVHEAGIDPVIAGELMGQGLTAQQVIAHIEHDIPRSVSQGWL